MHPRSPCLSRAGHLVEDAEHKVEGAAKEAGRDAEEAAEENASLTTKLAAPLGLVLGLALLAGGGYFFRDQLRSFIDYFIKVVDKWGPLG